MDRITCGAIVNYHLDFIKFTGKMAPIFKGRFNLAGRFLSEVASNLVAT
jgi:hypothetical protein